MGGSDNTFWKKKYNIGYIWFRVVVKKITIWNSVVKKEGSRSKKKAFQKISVWATYAILPSPQYSFYFYIFVQSILIMLWFIHNLDKNCYAIQFQCVIKKWMFLWNYSHFIWFSIQWLILIQIRIHCMQLDLKYLYLLICNM